MAENDKTMRQLLMVWSIVGKLEDAAKRERIADLAKYWPSVLDSLKKYLRETKTTRLNLRRTGIEGEELKSILMVLKESEVTELDLTDNRFESEMKAVSKLLTETKLKKLNLHYCDLIDENVLYLMQVLKDTQITHLDLSDNEEVDFADIKKSRQFVSSLLKSHLTVLNLSRCNFSSKAGALLLVRALPSSCITDLNLSQCRLSAESLTSLFSNLAATSITDLDVSGNKITFDTFQPISRSLKNSKLKKLNLSHNKLGDEGVDLLAETLPLCELISLNLSGNCISGANNLGRYLQNSSIEDLNLDGNPIAQITIFSFPNFVKGSSVTTLYLRSCQLGDELGKELMKSLEGSAVTKLDLCNNNLGFISILEFAKIVKNTVIEDVNFSSNSLSAEAISMLGDSLKGSKIKHIDISNIFNEPVGNTALSAFVAKTKDTSVKSLVLSSNHIDAGGAEMIASGLIDTTITHIDLSYNKIGVGAEKIAASLKGTSVIHVNLSKNKIGVGAVNLAAYLSSTEVTHLDLSDNDIDDEGIVALAECLKDSPIMELNLNRNSITSCGAKALAASLKKSSLLSLKLRYNKIAEDGFEALAVETENSFFNFFKGEMNKKPGEMSFLLFTDKYFWKNRILAHKLVSFFKQISPEKNSENLCFDRNPDNVGEFLEECVRFYKTVKELPAALSVLAEEDSVSFSRKQIASLLREEFPKQFIAFVDRQLKPNVTEFIKFMKKVEEMGMVEILKPLLIKPPLLKIGDSVSVTHPFFLKLLLKYEQPFWNIPIEPQNKIKVIRYLAENPNIEGASDTIKILCDEMLK